MRRSWALPAALDRALTTSNLSSDPSGLAAESTMALRLADGSEHTRIRMLVV